MAAVNQAIDDAIAQLPKQSSAAGSQASAVSPAPGSMTYLSGVTPATQASTEQMSAPTTQRAALTREEAIATDSVRFPFVGSPLSWT